MLILNDGVLIPGMALTTIIAPFVRLTTFVSVLALISSNAVTVPTTDDDTGALESAGTMGACIGEGALKGAIDTGYDEVGGFATGAGVETTVATIRNVIVTAGPGSPDAYIPEYEVAVTVWLPYPKTSHLKKSIPEFPQNAYKAEFSMLALGF